ncbi:hypothetical protein U3516DRAFT_766336 [Neocallimastix sp. 'constans']
MIDGTERFATKLEGMKYSRKKRIYTYLYPLLSRMIFEYMRDLKYKISEEKKHNNPYTTYDQLSLAMKQTMEHFKKSSFLTKYIYLKKLKNRTIKNKNNTTYSTQNKIQ